MLIASFGCSPETAAIEFNFDLQKSSSGSPNKAFHLIQSFAPGESTYVEAHTIGCELADRLLSGKYSYVCTTHTDRGHIHNHIIFNAINSVDYHKYNDNKRSYYHICKLSDELCSEHGLSVIIPDSNRGKKYNEWLATKNGGSIKNVLKNDIDDAIKEANSYKHFIELMRAKGYETKGESITDSNAKYIAFKPANYAHFIRGSARSLGVSYEKNEIASRIDEAIRLREVPANTRDNVTTGTSTKTVDELLNRRHKNPSKSAKFIDTSDEKFASSPGLSNWAKKQNLKAAAHMLSEGESIDELKTIITEKEAIFKSAHSSASKLDKQIKTAGEILKYAKQYSENKVYSDRLSSSKEPDRYFRNHDAQILLYNGANNFLRMHNIDPDRMDIPKMEEAFKIMQEKSASLKETYSSAKKEITVLDKRMQSLEQYINAPAQHSTQRKKERNVFNW